MLVYIHEYEYKARLVYQKLFALQEDALKVVANQKRLEIIHLLSLSELSVNEMVEMLGIRQANLSQHLSLLREAKIVMARREGVSIRYRLTDERVARACSLIKEFLKEQHSNVPEIAKMLSRSADGLYPVVKDVVCQMRISLSEASDTIQNDGETYYFCGSGCTAKFGTDPNQYIGKEIVHG